jgi:lipoyl-dependent peroxiredoxin
MDILRTADAVWQGDLRGGKGMITTPSGVLKDDAYTWAARFENAPGTNPEELIAAAQAACLSMAITSRLGRNGFHPESIATHATLTLARSEANTAITRMKLEITGYVPGMDEENFKTHVIEAEKGCPVSKLLHPGLEEVELVITLKQKA